MRDFSNQARQIKEDTTGTGSTGFGATPVAKRPLRRTDSPPISPGASFQASGNSKPPTTRPLTNPSRSGPTEKTNSTVGTSNQLSGTGLSNRQPAGSRQLQRVGQTGQIRSTSQTAISQRFTADLTRSTPGDRKLEGMQSPSVTIEKIAPSEIQVNQPADFQLVVKNIGRITAPSLFRQFRSQAVGRASKSAGILIR